MSNQSDRERAEIWLRDHGSDPFQDRDTHNADVADLVTEFAAIRKAAADKVREVVCNLSDYADYEFIGNQLADSIEKGE